VLSLPKGFGSEQLDDWMIANLKISLLDANRKLIPLGIS